MIASARHWLRDRLRRGVRDDGGAVAIWAALLTPVFLSLGALSVDLARLYNLDADLQTAADAMARAGAYELDGRSDSMTRATRAINNLPSNRQRFADGGPSTVTAHTIRFLTALPDDDDAPITSDLVTTNPFDARFVEVQVQPTNITTIFPPNLIRGVVRTTLEASAVGGRQAEICGAAPLFICDPGEGGNESLASALENREIRGRQIQLRGRGGSSAYFPGNFGFLEPPGSRSAADVRDMLGQVSVQTCFRSEGVILRTGQISSATNGINTRFDLYDGPFNNKKNDPAYAPAKNVTKGYTGAACNPSPSVQAQGLPRDNCFATGTCPHVGGRQGDGVWNVTNYFKVNHGSPATATIGGVAYTFNYTTGAYSPYPGPTRYEVYRWEIDNNKIPGSAGYGASKTKEVGTPRCATAAPDTAPDRRVIPVAVLQCQALQQHYDLNGNSGPVPASGFVKVFLTEPAQNGQEDIIWGELIGMVLKGVDPYARDAVQVRR